MDGAPLGRGVMTDGVRAASARVPERAGHVLEGVTRRSAVKDGEVLGQCIYAALRP